MVSFLGAWAHYSITPLVRRGTEKTWPDSAFPGGFHLVLDFGWVLYLMPVLVLLQWIASARLRAFCSGTALGLLGSFIALLFLGYGVLLAMPLISIGSYAK